MRPSSRGKQRKSFGEEIEIKLRVADRRALLRKLARLKARLERPRVREANALYDTGDGVLARNGQLLRIRVEQLATGAGKKRKRARGPDGGLFTYKGPQRRQGAAKGPESRRYKVREEREVRIADPEALAEILEAVGMRPWFRYEKFRSGFRLPGLPGLKVEVDETPIGDFLELEGDRETIDRAARRLGYEPNDYITLSYGALFREWCGMGAKEGGEKEPKPWAGLPDMVFPGRKR